MIIWQKKNQLSINPISLEDLTTKLLVSSQKKVAFFVTKQQKIYFHGHMKKKERRVEKAEWLIELAELRRMNGLGMAQSYQSEELNEVPKYE